MSANFSGTGFESGKGWPEVSEQFEARLLGGVSPGVV